MGTSQKDEDKARWEEDYELIENEGLFDEYLEMSEFLQYFIAFILKIALKRQEIGKIS